MVQGLGVWGVSGLAGLGFRVLGFRGSESVRV